MVCRVGRTGTKGSVEQSVEEDYWPKWKEVTEDWSKLHVVELHDMYSSPSASWVNKSRRKGWAGHVAHMGEKKNACRFW